MLVEHLAALTPRAVQTLAGLLSDKSGYIRLKAAKDILNRNGPSVSKEPTQTGQLMVDINIRKHDQVGRKESPPISVANASNITDLDLDGPEPPTVLPSNESSVEPQLPSDINNLSLDDNASQLAEKQPGGQKSRNKIRVGTPAHDFFPKVSPARVSEVLDLDVEPESIPGIENHGSVEDFVL
jgi:hypothetical protein